MLGLIWNLRDDRADWVRKLTEIMHGSHAELMLADGDPVVAAPFGPLEQERWEWSRPVTRDVLHRMAASRSYIITAPEDEKARIHGELDALFDELHLRGDATIDLPYVTRAYRAVRD